MSVPALAKVESTKQGASPKTRGFPARDHGNAANHDSDQENCLAETQERAAHRPQWSLSGIKMGLPNDSGEVQGAGLSPTVNQVLRTPGQRLDSTTRGTMESRFGHDFSRVRVHADPRASDSARAVGAGAFTVGDHVVFDSGFYSPETQGGRVVLAHELAHVVQQSNSTGAAAPNGPATEREALLAGEATRRPRDPIRVRERARPGVAAMSIADARRALWNHVPDGVKDYVRPIAQEAAAQMDKVIAPTTEIPKPIERLAEHPVDSLTRPIVHPLEAVSETVEAVKPGVKEAAAAIPRLVKEKAQQKVHDSVMESLGGTKGVVLEAANIVDTLAWLPYAAHEAERKALGTGATADTIILATDFMSNYAVLDSMVKKGYVAKNPATGEPTGAFSISGAVSQGIDEQADKVDRLLGNGKPEDALVFTSYELGELTGAIGTQVGLAFVGVEEVQLALKGIGAVGAAKNVFDAIEANPKGWETDLNFWAGLIGLFVTVIGLGSARASQKIPRILFALGALAGVAPLVSKIYQDYKGKPEGSERDNVLKQDFEALIKAIAILVMSVVHPAGKGKGGKTERPGPGRSGETAPREPAGPSEGGASSPQTQPAAPADAAAQVSTKATQPIAEPNVSVPDLAASPKVGESATPKPVAANHPGPAAEVQLLSNAPKEKPMAAVAAEPVSLPVESTAPAAAPKLSVPTEPVTAPVEPASPAPATMASVPAEAVTASAESTVPAAAPMPSVPTEPATAPVEPASPAPEPKSGLSAAEIDAINLRNKANMPKMGGEAPTNPDRGTTREQWKEMESKRRWANAVDKFGDALEGEASTSKVTGGPKSGYYIEDTKVPGEPQSHLDIDASPNGKDAPLPKRPGETSRGAVARVRAVIGKKISDIPELAKLWNDARASILSRRSLTADNYADLYDATRDAFWRRVGGKTPEAAAARKILQDAGFNANHGQKTAPTLAGTDPKLKRAETTISLDHEDEKAIGDNWKKALDPDNLQMRFAMPNTDREIRQARHPELRPGAKPLNSP
jgi:hypothetical protein